MLKDIALLSPVFTSLFWGLVFFLHPEKEDKVRAKLGAFMLLALIVYLSHGVFFSNFYHLYNYAESVYIFAMLSAYPVYYFYIKELSESSIRTREKVIHCFPAVFLGILSFIAAVLLTPEERVNYVKEILMERNLRNFEIFTATGLKAAVFFVGRTMFFVQAFYYAYRIFSLVSSFHEKLENDFSNTEGKRLKWATTISLIVLLASVSGITFTIIGRSIFAQNEPLLIIPSLIFTSLLFVIGYRGNLQVNVNHWLENDELKEEALKVKTNRKLSLKEQLIQLFEEDKIYTNPDLRMITLSELLKSNRTYISKCINDEFNINFNEFVNRYRIEEAKKLLRVNDQELYTIEYIAEKSGFGSVGSFTRVFKNFEGVTPGRYQEKISR